MTSEADQSLSQADLSLKYQPIVEAVQSNEWVSEQLARLAARGELDHTLRVAFLATELAKTQNIGASEIANLTLASLLHDLGKLEIAPEIFEKTDLTEEDRKLIDSHVRAGFEIVKQHLPMAAAIMVAHHEFQERAYPRQNDRKPDDQQLYTLQKLLALADHTDALLSARPYKEPWSVPEAKKYLENLFNDETLVNLAIAARMSLMNEQKPSQISDDKEVKEKPRRAAIISGFPGIGKTAFSGKNGSLKILDSDSSQFSWNKKGKRNPEWPNNYLDHIRENLTEADVILVSTNDAVRSALKDAGIRFVLVYPSLEMKEEYIERYISRGSDQKFVELLRKNYETWIQELMAQTGCRHVVLESGQYLSDVMLEILYGE